MGPSVKDLLIPFAQLLRSLAGLVWLIAFIIGLVDYEGARKGMRKNRKIARPYGLILSGGGLTALVVGWLLLFGESALAR